MNYLHPSIVNMILKKTKVSSLFPPALELEPDPFFTVLCPLFTHPRPLNPLKRTFYLLGVPSSASHRKSISLRMVWGFTFDPRTPKIAKFLNSQASPSTQPHFCLQYYGFPYIQGQLTEVPINFDFFTKKVVGKTR